MSARDKSALETRLQGMNALEITAVTKSYGPVRAVAGVDLVVPTGQHTAIVGASGSGKTTLLRLIAGFEAPDSGRVTLHGRVVADTNGTMVPAHQRNVGYLPQDGALFPHLSVAANIAFGIANEPNPAARVDALAKMVALDPAMLRRWPHELSGGQQQRVALARALAHQPKVILLDEPFSALDTSLRAATRKATVDLLDAAGVTAILVTHDQAEALSFSDQIAVMRDGRIVQAGPPVELYLRPRDAVTAAFLGDAVIVDADLHGGWANTSLGRLPVDDSTRSGRARVLLRPEQVRIAEGAIAEVVGSEFTGHSSVLTVALPTAGNPRIQVRCPIGRVPAIGTKVGFAVEGVAHVLSD